VRRLSKRGYLPCVALTGSEAEEKIAEWPDIVLLDMMLPDNPGWVLAEKWKGTEEYRHIPIIGVSAMAYLSDQEIALCNGCDSYVTKPIDLAVLLSEIERLLAGGSSQRP